MSHTYECTRAAARAWTALRPPRDLLGLVRWAALLVTLLLAAQLALTLAARASVAWPFTAVWSCGLAWLCWRWARGYLAASFSLAGCLSEGIALLPLQVVTGDPFDAVDPGGYHQAPHSARPDPARGTVL